MIRSGMAASRIQRSKTMKSRQNNIEPTATRLLSALKKRRRWLFLAALSCGVATTPWQAFAWERPAARGLSGAVQVTAATPFSIGNDAASGGSISLSERKLASRPSFGAQRSASENRKAISADASPRTREFESPSSSVGTRRPSSLAPVFRGSKLQVSDDDSAPPVFRSSGSSEGDGAPVLRRSRVVRSDLQLRRVPDSAVPTERLLVGVEASAGGVSTPVRNLHSILADASTSPSASKTLARRAREFGAHVREQVTDVVPNASLAVNESDSPPQTSSPMASQDADVIGSQPVAQLATIEPTSLPSGTEIAATSPPAVLEPEPSDHPASQFAAAPEGNAAFGTKYVDDSSRSEFKPRPAFEVHSSPEAASGRSISIPSTIEKAMPDVLSPVVESQQSLKPSDSTAVVHPPAKLTASQMSSPTSSRLSPVTTREIFTDGTQHIRTSRDITAVEIDNGEVCEVLRVSSREIVVVGKSTGSAAVRISFDSGTSEDVHLFQVTDRTTINVPNDGTLESLQSVVHRKFRGSELQLTTRQGSLLVKGMAADPQQAVQILAFIRETCLVPVIDQVETSRSSSGTKR